jgi:hypothetical protein
MIKKTLLVVLFAAFMLATKAQVSAIDGMVEYQKGQNKHSSKIELAYPADVVKNAIKESMAKQGIKEQRIKGVQVFKGVRLEGDSELSDLHFKVEPKSRKEKDITVVHLIVGRSSENVALRAENDMHKSEHGKAFLNTLAPAVGAHNLEVGIKDQDAAVKKAEKKLKNLENEQKNLERRLQDLQDKLVQNQKDQEAQTAEVAKQHEVLESMQSRRTATQ